MSKYVDRMIEQLNKTYPWEKEFLQASIEVLESLRPVMEKDSRYEEAAILERIVVPERTIMFRVPWMDDNGKYHVNHGFRVQFNSALGPYKGGLRFHPSVNLSILKFLGFEQIFKNSLTGLPMGGGKGGSDFDPRGKSSAEVMRFCQSFMSELWRHIGQDLDVPAGDIGVGGREIGFLMGQYKKLANIHQGGVLTGKGQGWGGSKMRPEATGFGVVYFAQEMLATKGDSFAGKKVAISGFGNVAWGAVRKATELGAKVVTISGPDGFVYDANGISTPEKIAYMLEMRASGRDKAQDYADKFGAEFHAGKRPWCTPVDVAIPCATQNELGLEDVKELKKNGVIAIPEASNMSTTPEAMEFLFETDILFSPGKASNAGGVATSGLEMSQNSLRFGWESDEVDQKLHTIMKNIHKSCKEAAEQFGTPGNYVNGANIAGFLRVANAMIDQGVC